MSKQLLRLALLLILVSVACSLPAYASQSTQAPQPQAVSALYVTAGPDATLTPTPFQPIGPTSTATITATPTPTETPEPTGLEIPGLPTPVRVSQKLPDGQINLMVIGNDYRPNAGFRTDVLMLVSINTGKGTVSVVSFPRDLYVTIPGWETNRINTAFPRGGFNTLADTLEYNFGVRPTYYIMTNFQGFISIVNSLGGVNVNVGQSLSDTCDLPQEVNGYCSVSPGSVSMDGATALWYVRSRHSSSDFDRLRRAQEVLYAVFAKLMSLDAVSRLPELYSAYKSSVETNMSVESIAPLLPVASQVIGDSSRVRRFSIGPAQVSNYITSGGAMVLLPNYGAISSIIAEAIYNQ